MKKIITFTDNDFKRAYTYLLPSGEEETDTYLLQSGQEEAVFFLAGTSKTKEILNLLVREVIPVPSDGFLKKEHTYLSIDPDFMMPIIKRAKLEELSVISAHSHPWKQFVLPGSHGTECATFSTIDDRGDELLFPRIQQRVPNRPHASMVFALSGIDARLWESGARESQPLDFIRVVGHTIKEIYPTSSPQIDETKLSEMHDRQILAFGEVGQERIQKTKVGIVGLGGTGSLVFQQLAHLGVKRFTIVDDDCVEKSNRSRIVGSSPEDSTTGRPKVEVMERLGKEIDPSVEIHTVRNSVNNLSAALQLRDADIIFCCTDNLSSRLVLNRIALQYLIPLIDIGIKIQSTEQGKIHSACGRVMVLLPDDPCLACLGIITPEALQLESDHETGYISGENIPDPSVISLNGVVASLAVTEFIDLLTGFERRKEHGTYQIYDILKGVIWREKTTPTHPCNTCSEVRALGDNLQLPCKSD